MQLSNLTFRFLSFVVVLLAAQSFIGKDAAFADSLWVSDDHVKARLLIGREVPQTGAIDAMVQLRLAEGWNTYWRIPGDTGLPPRFDWGNSKNLASVFLEWPVPARKKEMDFTIFSYDGDVEFPLVLTPEDPEKPIELALDMDVMVCRQICIPQALSLKLEVEGGDNANQPLIDFARRRVPAKDNTAALKIENVVAGPKGIVVSVFSQGGFAEADVFAALDDVPLTAMPDWQTGSEEERRARVLLPAPEEAQGQSMPAYISGKTLFVTIKTGGRAIEREIMF